MKIVFNNKEYRDRTITERKYGLIAAWALFKTGKVFLYQVPFGLSGNYSGKDMKPIITKLTWRVRISGLYKALKPLVSAYLLRSTEKTYAPKNAIRYMPSILGPRHVPGIDVEYHFRDYFDTDSFKRNMRIIKRSEEEPCYAPIGLHLVGELHGRKDDMPARGKFGVNPFAPENQPFAAKEQ